MKIKVAFLPEEEKQAAATVAQLVKIHPGAKVHKKEAHPPFKHVYLTTRKPEKRDS